jgi:hypothetical protein
LSLARRAPEPKRLHVARGGTVTEVTPIKVCFVTQTPGHKGHGCDPCDPWNKFWQPIRQASNYAEVVVRRQEADMTIWPT